MIPLRVAALLLAVLHPGCICAPGQDCQLVRALCRIDLCVERDPYGWAACHEAPATCDSVEPGCVTRADCVETFLARCTASMTPDQPRYSAYLACARIDCSRRSPAPPDAPRETPADAAPPPPRPDAAPARPDAAPPGKAPPIAVSCCADSPLCDAQGKVCCFVPESGAEPAQTRCLTTCSSEARHCAYAPYRQPDGARSCLPPPHDTSGVACPY